MAEQPTNLSDYELQRLAHIRRNHEFLVSLGLADAAVDPVEAMRTGNKKKPSKPRAPRRPKIAPPPESLRRSPRLKGEEAEFGAEIAVDFGAKIGADLGAKIGADLAPNSASKLPPISVPN